MGWILVVFDDVVLVLNFFGKGKLIEIVKFYFIWGSMCVFFIGRIVLF